MNLKTRIFLIFSISSLACIMCISVISYYTIFSILNNKIEMGIQGNPQQVEMELNGTFKNLNQISEQLAFSGSLGGMLNEFMQTKEPYQRQVINSDLKEEVNLISFSNPNIGLVMYYFDRDHSYQFENFPVKDDFRLDNLVIQYYGISYYGPHASQYRFSPVRR